jgi:hypothetical protein
MKSGLLLEFGFPEPISIELFERLARYGDTHSGFLADDASVNLDLGFAWRRTCEFHLPKIQDQESL